MNDRLPLEQLVPGLVARCPRFSTIWVDNIAQRVRDYDVDGGHKAAGNLEKRDVMFVLAVEPYMAQYESGERLMYNVLVMSKDTVGWIVEWDEADITSFFRFPLR